jgi:glycerol-3-phosphate dehydrogenase
MSEATFDAAIIGGGVVGCAVLRALTLAGLKCVLLERGADILSGASKGNSAILHTGFDAPEVSLELRLMQAGRAEYLAIRDRLNLPVVECGAILAAWDEEQAGKLPAIEAQAHRNGVTDVRAMKPDEIAAALPRLAKPTSALTVPGEWIIDPWSAPLAYAMQAIQNGAEIRRMAEVTGAIREDGIWRLATSCGPLAARIVVNCAGNFGDHVEALCRPPPFAIRPRRGQFAVFDKTALPLANRIVLPVPTERTKGVVLFPTVFGNVAIGPTAEDQEDREAATTDQETLENLRREAERLVPALAAHPVTATYAGLRPATDRKDYVIEVLPRQSWICVAGIRSTGLTAALGAGAHVAGLVETHFQSLAPLKNPLWPRMPNLAEHLPRDHDRAGRGALACLCELATWDEVEAALSGPLPAGDLGGLKRRTRAMMGRCQGSNCLPHIVARCGDRLIALRAGAP